MQTMEKDPTVPHASPRTGTQTLSINATVTVQFSEPVSFTSIRQQTVVLSTGGVPVNTQFTLERNNTVLRITPANLLPLQANKFYSSNRPTRFGVDSAPSSCYSHRRLVTWE